MVKFDGRTLTVQQTRAYFACVDTSGPSGVIRLRAVCKALGLSSPIALRDKVKALVEVGLIRVCPTRGNRNRYVVNPIRVETF